MSRARPAVPVRHALLSAAALTLAAPALASAAPSFAPRVTLDAQHRPAALAVADLNADGKLDIVSGSTITDVLQVFLGDGSGGFAAPTTVGSSDNPYGPIAVADLNGDARPDVVAAAFGNTSAAQSRLDIRLGDGLGGLGAATTIPAGGTFPYGVRAGLINADAIPDLAVPSSSDNGVAVHLGSGNGTFAPSTLHAAGNDIRDVAIGDVTGDGKTDLVAASTTDGAVAVLAGDGAGGFVATVPLTAASGTRSVALGDLDGDTDLDIVAVNQNDGSIMAWRSLGAGTFSAPATKLLRGVGANTDVDPVSVALADFDGDGALDAATTNTAGNGSLPQRMLVVRGDGAGGFTTFHGFAGEDLLDILVAGDLDRDGKPDVVGADGNALPLGGGAFKGTVSTWRNTTTFPEPTPSPTPPPASTPGPTPEPAAAPAPAPSVPPAAASPTPAPATPPVATTRPVAIATLATLPAAKRCLSRRSFPIRIRKVSGVTIVSARVKVNGRSVKVVRGARLTAPVDLRGLPAGRFTVTIEATTSTGTILRGSRKYRTCARKRLGGRAGR